MDKLDVQEYIRQLDFDHVVDYHKAEYAEKDIVFITDLRSISFSERPVQLDLFAIVGCYQGKLQVEINTELYTLTKNEILVCRLNDVVSNCMISTDFKGGILCLSRRGLLEQLSESELWERAFYFAKRPVIKVKEDSLKMLIIYGSTLRQKNKMEQLPFHREIIVSLVKAALYEILGNVTENRIVQTSTPERRGDVLFKRFIALLTKTRIKPRDISWYANELCVSPKYLSMVCKRVSNKTALAWITEYVIIDIRYLLKSTNKSIKEIAEIQHFPSISFFGKFCRHHFGLSPTEFRKQLRSKAN